MLKKYFLFFFIFFGVAQPFCAQLRIPAFLSSGMVLQQQKTNRIWGWAGPGQLVQVEFMQKTYPAFADAQGKWQVFLEPARAGKGGAMRISAGTEQILLEDILLGEVWICSGQSNMEWKMNWIGDTYREELQTANNDQIRYVTLERAFANAPQQNTRLEKPWSPINPETLPECSAVAYFYARYLQQKLQVPVGLIITSWGGTPAESWTSFEALHPFPAYTDTYIQKIKPLNLQEAARQRQQKQEAYLQVLRDKHGDIQRALQPDFDDSRWQQAEMPKSWEQQGFGSLDGVMVYRFSFELSAAQAGKPANLYLPAIDDTDSTYLNGKWIGTDNQWNVPRKYTIPKGILRKGRNILAIRVQDNAGGGGLADQPDKFRLEVQSRSFPLAGNAKYQWFASLEQVETGPGPMQVQPAVLYNAMIAPLLPLSIRGAIWYQGESNADRAAEYRSLFPAMIQDWRNRWGQGDFPFLFVQLSSYGKVLTEPAASNWAMLREAQAKTRSLPNTAMAVTIDIGDPNDIHPKQKKEVGERLAAEAMRMVYAQDLQVVSSGPRLKTHHIEGNRVILEFDHAGSGLVAKNGPLQHFAVAGADKKFYWAEAQIEGNRVVLTCKQVSAPVAVRYAWANSPISANLFNLEGFPAEPFRTDDWADAN